MNCLCISLFIIIFVVIYFAASSRYDYWTRDDLRDTCDKQVKTKENLLIVNMFVRHGDRAPLDNLPPTDRHAEKVEFFWPRGIEELTEVGFHRMFAMGVALRQLYRKNNQLNYDTKSTLALTSNVTRNRETLYLILRGLYEMNTDVKTGYELSRKLLLNKTEDVPTGAGTSAAWSDIELDNDFVPSLDWRWFIYSAYNQHHPSALDESLTNSPEVMNLTHIEEVMNILTKRYQIRFTSTNVCNLWSAIDCELHLDRTNETLGYLGHLADLITKVVEYDASLNQTVNLFEVWEAATLLAYTLEHDELYANYLNIAPIATSMIESQSIAMGEKPKNERSKRYVGKKMIFYSTHDNIMSSMLYDFGVITVDGPTWARRLMEAKKRGASFSEMYVSGLRMCRMGMSAKFELWQISHEETDANSKEMEPETESSSKRGSMSRSVAVIRLGIYNDDDPFAPVIWEPVKFGEMCRAKYSKMYNSDQFEPIGKYYPKHLAVDIDYDCPFELFKNITAPWMMNDTLYELIYNDKFHLI